MKTALCTIAFRERTFEEVLDLACGAGFDGVEPWGKPDHIQSDWDAESVERSADEIKKRGLKVSQYGSTPIPLLRNSTMRWWMPLRLLRVLKQIR